MMVIDLLVQFPAGEHDFIGVDDDDMIAGVGMRSIGGLMLAAQDVRDLAGQTSEHHALGIDKIPFALDGSGLGHKRCHVRFLPFGLRGQGRGGQSPPSVSMDPGLAESIDASAIVPKESLPCQGKIHPISAFLRILAAPARFRARRALRAGPFPSPPNRSRECARFPARPRPPARAAAAVPEHIPKLSSIQRRMLPGTGPFPVERFPAARGRNPGRSAEHSTHARRAAAAGASFRAGGPS